MLILLLLVAAATVVVVVVVVAVAVVLSRHRAATDAEMSSSIRDRSSVDFVSASVNVILIATRLGVRSVREEEQCDGRGGMVQVDSDRESDDDDCE